MNAAAKEGTKEKVDEEVEEAQIGSQKVNVRS